MIGRTEYIAHLIAQNISESFLLAYARTESGDGTAQYARERGVDKLKELAAHLGYALVSADDTAASLVTGEQERERFPSAAVLG